VDPAPPGRSGAHESSARDFDFLLGRWRIANRWRSPAGEWFEFESTARVTDHLDGLVLVDEYEILEFPTRGRVLAFNLRAFDGTTGDWQLVWLSTYSPPDMRPVVGRWTSPAMGEFFQSLEAPSGRPAQLRFRYTRPTDDTVHWEQAWSFDGGTAWVVDWTMDWTRETGHI
jgi:hypothetical protein